MSYALVGSLGTVQTAAAGAAISGLAYGQTPTANNLLTCWWAGTGSTTLPSTPAGWSSALSKTGTSCAVVVFYKVAAGGDAVPSFSGITSTVQLVQLGEFSGNATSTPADQSGSAAGTTSPLVATAASADAAGGELIVYSCVARYSAAATKTLASSLNNGATAHDTTNNASSSTSHYDFGYGITTGNGSADSDSYSFTTTSIGGAAVAIASFKLGAAAPATPAVQAETLMMVGVGS